MTQAPLAAALAVSLALLAPAAHAASDPSKCKLTKVAELPVTMSGLSPLISVKINGTDTQLVAASGDFFNTLGSDAMTRFGLKPVPVEPGTRLRGLGGGEIDMKVGQAQTFELAGIPFKKVDFVIGGRGDSSEKVAGSLGRNILNALDVEYDLANGVIRLFLEKDCGDVSLAYWAREKPYSILKMSPNDPGQTQILAMASIDGKPIHVEFSSTGPSYLNRRAAAKVGINPAGDGVVAAGAISTLSGGALETSIAPFDSFAIGDEEIKHTRLRVANIDMPYADMLLGGDFFLSHRIFMSNHQRRIYLSFNGGAVFKLDGAASKVAEHGSNDSTTSPVVATETPTDAAGFSRRGAAFMARRAYPEAVADYTKAVELAPNDPSYLRGRAQAHFAAHETLQGLADLEKAIKLKPDDRDALMMRAQIYMSSKDYAHAEADLDAVAKLDPNSFGAASGLAAVYIRGALYPQAIARYDKWIASHPKDDNLPAALNGRCWTRAIWGQQLNEALADCDMALKKGLHSSNVFDSRGLVRLRLGKLDDAIADYDAAIKLQPKDAWSLYGRGLAKQRKGLTSDGAADIEAAKALQPTLPETARRYGILDSKPAA